MTLLKLHKSSVWRLLRLTEKEVMLGSDGETNYRAQRQGEYIAITIEEKKE